MRTIAVFLPNWVGDAVMATPALRALREHFPASHLIGVLRPTIAQVLEGTHWLNACVTQAARGSIPNAVSTIWSLRRFRPDLAVLLTNSFRTAFMARLSVSRRVVGYAGDARGFLLTEVLVRPRDSRGRRRPSPVIDDYNRLIQHLGCRGPGYRLELATTPQDEAAADALWAHADFARRTEVICLNPGAAYGPAKRWPVQSFGRLAQILVDRRESGVLILCGPGEQDVARSIQEIASRRQVHTLAECPVSIGLTKACVRRCDLLVSTDSGPRHFAAAFDRPVITLFGPTHIRWTETYFAKAVHLQKSVPCGPCQLRVCPLDHRCMNSLTPEEVAEAATNLLVRYPPRRTPLVAA